MVTVSRVSAEEEIAVAYRGNVSGRARRRIDRHYERLILVLYKVQMHTGTGEMVERDCHNYF
jgi:hypothetical protein